MAEGGTRALRLLGVDFGGRRIGLAVGESVEGIASPRPPLTATGTLRRDAAAISSVATREEAEMIIVGVPLIAGAETGLSRVCRRLQAEIAALGHATACVDESLTSHDAETEMRALGLKGSEIRKRVDGEAACRILERYMGEG